jgi:site-specific DNA-methyltransferase (cytosine-N4-specific)
MLQLLEPASEAHVQISNGDSRDIAEIIPHMTGKIDVLITSPPYATALPYLDTDRLSLIVLGLDQRAKHKYREIKMIGTREVSERQRQEWWALFESRCDELPHSVTTLIKRLAVTNHRDGTGFRRKNLPALLGVYFLSMLDSMTSAHQLMKKSGKAFYVVGNNSTNVDGKRVEIRTNELLVDIAELAGWKTANVLGMDLLTSRDIFRQNRGTAESILMLEA